MIPELFAVGSGLVSFFEGQAAYDRKSAERDAYVKSLEGLLIKDPERKRRIDAVSDMFNPAIMNDLNQSAVGNAISGKLNPVSYSKLIPEKLQAINREANIIDSQNLSISQKISEVSLMDIPKPGFGDVIGSAISGHASGMQIDEATEEEKRRDKRMKLLESLLGENSGKTNAANTMTGMFPNVIDGI